MSAAPAAPAANHTASWRTILCWGGGKVIATEDDREHLRSTPVLYQLIYGGEGFMPPKGVLRLEWMGVTAKQLRAVLTYLRSGVILPTRETRKTRKTRETHKDEAKTTASQDRADLARAFSHLGGCPDLDAQVKAEQTRKLQAPPTCPEEDVEEQYLWQAVCMRAYHNLTEPEGFHLTGEFFKVGGAPTWTHMWSRKLR